MSSPFPTHFPTLNGRTIPIPAGAWSRCRLPFGLLADAGIQFERKEWQWRSSRLKEPLTNCAGFVNVMGINNLGSNPNTRKVNAAAIREPGHQAIPLKWLTPRKRQRPCSDQSQRGGSRRDAVAGLVEIMIHTAGEGENSDDVFVAVNTQSSFRRQSQGQVSGH